MKVECGPLGRSANTTKPLMQFDTTRTSVLTLTFGPELRASLADPDSRTDSRVLLVVLCGATGSIASLEMFLRLGSFKVRMFGDPEKAAVFWGVFSVS